MQKIPKEQNKITYDPTKQFKHFINHCVVMLDELLTKDFLFFQIKKILAIKSLHFNFLLHNLQGNSDYDAFVAELLDSEDDNFISFLAKKSMYFQLSSFYFH